MIVRLADRKDLSKGLQMFDSINNEELFRIDELKELGIEFDRDVAERFIEHLVNLKSVFVMDDKGIVGTMAGMYITSFFSKDIIFQSCLFYIKPEYRKFATRFIKRIEDLLRPTQVTKLIISNLDISRYKNLGRYYEMLGFKRLESHYLKGV
jgi:hypothetical protein